MNQRKLDIAYFISFCIEQYKIRIGATGKEVMDLFDRYGVTDYLAEHYEALHTQSHRWLMEEIESYIQKQKEYEAVPRKY